MAQIQATFWGQMTRAGLPLLLYGLVLGGDLMALGPLRGEWPAVVLSFGWPVLLAGLGAVLVLLALRPVVAQAGGLPGGYRWRGPVVVGLGAYLLGCLLQLLPSAWWHWYTPDLRPLGWEPLYWWPFFSSTAKPQGWTLPPPLFSAGYALIPPAEASAIKLGTLLATLLLYRHSHSRANPAPPESAASVQSA